MEEIWTDINDYDGLYQISNYGRVLSLRREVKQGNRGHTRVVQEKLLKPTDNGNGYLIIALRENGRRKNFYVHRLVADHFVANISGGLYVNHKDYDTRNNRYDNLEWCTQQQNVRYSADRMRKPHKQWKPSATGEKYIYFRGNRYRLSIRGFIDKTYPTIDDAICAREVVLRGEEHIAV